MRCLVAFLLVLVGPWAAAQEASVLHVVSTSEVRGTVGICG